FWAAEIVNAAHSYYNEQEQNKPAVFVQYLAKIENNLGNPRQGWADIFEDDGEARDDKDEEQSQGKPCGRRQDCRIDQGGFYVFLERHRALQIFGEMAQHAF